jgi:hypothetical protein
MMARFLAPIKREVMQCWPLASSLCPAPYLSDLDARTQFRVPAGEGGAGGAHKRGNLGNNRIAASASS